MLSTGASSGNLSRGWLSAILSFSLLASVMSWSIAELLSNQEAQEQKGARYQVSLE